MLPEEEDDTGAWLLLATGSRDACVPVKQSK